MGCSWCFPNFPALLSASPFTSQSRWAAAPQFLSLPAFLTHHSQPLLGPIRFAEPLLGAAPPAPGPARRRAVVAVTGVSIQAGISVVFGPSAALREPGTRSRAHSSAPGRRLESLLSRALQRESSHPSRSPAAPREPPAALQPQQSDRHQPSL